MKYGWLVGFRRTFNSEGGTVAKQDQDHNHEEGYRENGSSFHLGGITGKDNF
jgi:hypothetical protein